MGRFQYEMMKAGNTNISGFLLEYGNLCMFIWEKANGSVPDNMIVVFKNKDTMNCDLSNLEIIDRKENMMRNTYHRYPEELSRLIQIKGALTRQINKQK